MRVRWMLIACMTVACADASLAPDPGLLDYVTLSAGTEHTCGTVTGGQLYCWGGTGSGLLASNADTGIIAVPQRVLLGPIQVTSVSAGREMDCALTTQARALCWGTGAAGPRPSAGADGLTTVAAGDFACGLNQDGGALCWTAPGATATDISAPGAFHALAVGGIACGVLADSTAACWNSGQPAERVTGTASLRSIAAGNQHGCGVTSDGTVECWGANDSGQLGDDSHIPHAAAQPVALDQPAQSVAASADYACALTITGDVWCWGAIPWLDQSYAFPVRAGIGFRLTALALGSTHACAKDAADGTPYCWGQNDVGELGDGTLTPATQPVIVDGVR